MELELAILAIWFAAVSFVVALAIIAKDIRNATEEITNAAELFMAYVEDFWDLDSDFEADSESEKEEKK